MFLKKQQTLLLLLLLYDPQHVSSSTLLIFKKQKEWKTTQHITKNNNFPRRLLQKLNHQIQNKVNHTHNEKKHKIWTTFTYHSPKIRRITNLFKNTNMGIAFKVTATLQQLFIPTTQIQTSKHEKVEYTISHAKPTINHMQGKPIAI